MILLEFHAAWPILDQTRLFDDLYTEAKRELRGLVRSHGYVVAGCGSWKRTETHMTWSGPVREPMRSGRLPEDFGEFLPADPLLSWHRPSNLTERQSKVLERARKLGRISRTAADDLCCNALGIHPCELWGEDWWAA